jgi:3,4-dihydroxy 2-butanone 4-phosphate synthase/GTP cyclohydrolase II
MKLSLAGISCRILETVRESTVLPHAYRRRGVACACGGRKLDTPYEVANVELPTPFGPFQARAFECTGGFVYLALTRGVVAGRENVLTRLHSECLTGDALGSLRCDCGLQLRTALRRIAGEGTGVLVYATGHEGRGVGLVNKLRAYIEQDDGADTLDANLRLGLPADARDYSDAAAVLAALDVRSVRLLTNNPRKVTEVTLAGVPATMEPLAVAPHTRNHAYLATKAQRMGHVSALPDDRVEVPSTPPDVSQLLGHVEARDDRPYTVLKYAQTLDGRIATACGDSKWISGEEERRVSHALRAASDAVLVGVGTVLADDPQLTVRMVPGISPMRVVLDSRLRTPVSAQILDADAATLILTTPQAPPGRRVAMSDRGATVRVADCGAGGVAIRPALRALHDEGVDTLLVEGGARVITSLLAAGVVDRIIVAVAPTIIGAGTEAVGDLGIALVSNGMRLVNACVSTAGDDLLIAGDVAYPGQPAG